MGSTAKQTSRVKHAPPSGAFAALAFGLVLALIVLEVGLRVFQPIPIRMRGDHILLPRNVVYNIHNGAPRGLGGKLDENLVHTKNSLGFRGAEPPANFDDAVTIVTIGGSTTECFYLGDADTWPAQLGERLSKHFNSLWINNAGLDGHSTFGHLQLMREYISALHPKFVTILAGINDMFADEPNGYDKAPIQSTLSELARYSDLVALGMTLWRHEKAVELRDLGAMPRPINLHDAIYHAARPVADGQAKKLADEEAARLRSYRRRLTQLVGLAKQSGIEPILITQPALFGPAIDDVTQVDLSEITTQFTVTLSGAEAWAVLERYNDTMREVGRENGISVIDLAKLMPKSSRYYYDFLHFSKDGAAEVAAILDREMCPILAKRAPGSAAGECSAS